MKVSSLVAACGLCVCLAGPLVAQTEKPSPSRVYAPSTPASASSSDHLSLLKQMEGQWKVDVSVNTSLWNPHLFTNDKKGTNPSEANPTNPANPTTPTNPSNPTDPARNPDSTQNGAETMQSFTAYSTSKLILGENVLQQSTVMPDLKSRMSAEDKRNDRSENRSETKSVSQEMFKGLSLLSFDENAKTYSMAFLSNCESQIQLKSGTYQATSTQLVFQGSHGHQNESYGQPNTTAQPGHSPNSVPNSAPNSNPVDSAKSPTWRPSDNAAHANAMMGCQVVVDIISPDEHHVTMYASEVSATAPTSNVKPRKLDSNPPDNASPGTTKRTESKGTLPAPPRRPGN